MFKHIFSFFLFSFLLFSPHAMANTSYTMSDTLLNYINNLSPSTSGYTSIKNDGSDGNALFSILYYDENGDEQNLYFNVYNGDDIVEKSGERLSNTTGDINNNFIGLSIASAAASGGAIYNNSNTSTIDNIIGDFIGNYAKSSTTARGGAIYNYQSTIDYINGDFIGNYVSSSSSSNYAQGGAIYHSGTITTITGDFIGNYAYASGSSTPMQGGAIYTTSSIDNITGDFIGNYVYGSGTYAQGGAIYTTSSIKNIIGDFIGNYAKSDVALVEGGAIFNNGSTAKIDTIKGDFIGNYASASAKSANGGAIYLYGNSATISTIIGDFIGNYAEASANSASGGAIYNTYYATISTIIGDFIGNYAEASANSASGGAIYNASSGSISFLADNRTSYFTDNYTLSSGVKNYNAIHNEQRGTITFDMQGNGSFVMNDSITGNDTGTINIKGQDANDNIFYLNDTITNNIINVENATLELGSYIHNDGTKTSWVGTQGTMSFTNSIIYLDMIDYDYNTNTLFGTSTINVTNTSLTLRNIDIDTYNLGSTTTARDFTITSASSLHKVNVISDNQFEIAFNPTSTLVTNSQLGDFMAEINKGSDLSAQSESSATRFIFQTSQLDIDTKKQAAIVDAGAQLSAVGASSALTRSAISAKQGTINTRISQEVAYNVENFIASSENIGGLITEKKVKDISLWLMPNYTYERISDMQSGSFSHGYTSHLFGITLGTDKTFTPNLTKFYTLGLALDGGMGFSNTNQDYEHIKNDFCYYGISTYGAVANRNLIFSTNIGYEINNSEIRQLLENYNIEENLAASLETSAIYAKLKAEYQLEFEGYFYLAPLYKKLFKKNELEKIEAIENLENLSFQELEKELEKHLLQLEKELKYQLAQMEKEEEKPREYNYIHLAIKPYLGLEFVSTNTGSYEIYSYDTTNNTETTFNVESERQNIYTIPLGIQIKPELAEVNSFKVSPQVTLGIAYSFGDLAEKSTTTAKGLTSIAYLETENIDAIRGDFGLSANVKSSRLNNINFDLGYDLEVSKNRHAHNLFAKASYEF